MNLARSIGPLWLQIRFIKTVQLITTQKDEKSPVATVSISRSNDEKSTMLRDRPRWWIGKDSLGIGKDSLGIVYDVTHCYNLEKKCLPAY